MKSMSIIKDGNEGEVEVKRLGNPVKRTVITNKTTVDDAGEDDVSGLNSDPGKGRPTQERPAPKKPSTLIGNMGPDKNGKINFSENEDCISTILQYHETYQFENTEDGFLQTGEKCWRQFNKLFSAKVTAQEIADALKKSYGCDAKPRAKVAEKQTEKQAENNTPKTPEKPLEKDEVYFPIESRALEVLSGKAILDGPKFEICKILNCPNICLMQRKKGPASGNKVFLAACKNSKDGAIIEEGCPQEQKLSEKEQFLLQYTTQQFGGDVLQAKKFLYLSRSLRDKI